MSFKPLHDYVLVKRRDVAEEQYGGIIIPDTAKDKPQEGEVLAVGPGKRLDSGELRSMTVVVGNAVLFGKYAGTEIKMNGEDLLVMRESDILGILDA
jgi:chaperonin GroES